MKPDVSGRPLRVLHIYRTYFPDPPGGLQEAIRQICLGTRDFGVESRVFTLSPQPQPMEVELPEGTVVRARSWAAPASCDLGGPGSFLRYRQLAQWADVLNFHFPWPFADVLRLLGGSRKPAVMTYHSDIVRQRHLGEVYAPLMRWMLSSMSAVIATSPTYLKTSPVLFGQVDRDKLRMIPLGIGDYADSAAAGMAVDRQAYASAPPRLGLGQEPFFLALGVLRYYKGLHTLVQAAPRIASKIVIAGSGPEMERLKELARQVGAANVVFAGQVTDEEKRALLATCRALVLPSHLRSEAFGMVLVEAAMFSKPMVCCEIGSGTSYVNQHGVTGLVVPPESPEALAEAIRTLASENALAGRMGRAARDRYETLFSGAALGKAYSDLYREVLADS